MVSLASIDRSTPATAGSKPLLRTTMSGTIRKAQDAELDDDLLAEMPKMKRARVTFNPNVEEKVLEEYVAKGRTVESVRTEIKRAIEAHGRGYSEKYDAIKGIFVPRREDDEDDEEQDATASNEEMKIYLLALTNYVSLLNKNCNGLVRAILACEWMGREESFVKVYAQFLGNLVSTQGAYVGMVLGMLVGHFTGGMSKYPSSMCRAFLTAF
jgi:RNA polymerase I-specific transcription initiation factor RRN3